MPEFMLLMRGSQTVFLNMTAAEQKEVISQHMNWAKELTENGILVNGAGLSNDTVLLKPNANGIKQITKPFKDTESELSGFYIIKAENLHAAVEVAHKCPALSQGESVEIIPFGH